MYKKFVPAVLATALLLSLLPAPAAAAAAPGLTDITGHWAEAEIRDAAAAGWVDGYPDATFRPEGLVTRAEFIKMLAAIRGGPAPAGEGVIPDPRLAALADRIQEKENWAVAGGYVDRALALGYLEPSDYAIKLTDAGALDRWYLSPGTAVTRTDATVLVTRALGFKYAAENAWLHPGSQYAAAVPAPKYTFADSLPDWAKGWVTAATSTYMVTGYPDNTFRGGQPLKRSEAVVLLTRLADRAQVTIPMQTLHFTDADKLDWQGTAAAWAAMSRTDRADAVRTFTQAFWAQVGKANRFPLTYHTVMVSVVGKENQQLGEGHYDGTTFTYLDAQGMATPTTPAPAADLAGRLTVTSSNLAEQTAWTKENARAVLPGMNVTPTATFTFPYQYLGDWFLTPAATVDAWAKAKIEAYWTETKARYDAIGIPLASVAINVVPADTADRGGKYRSLIIGDTLIDNPVLRLTYDGKSVTTVSRPATLRSYLDNLHPTYEMEPAGEGSALPHTDPAEPEARTIMETFIMTLGRVPGR